MKEMKQGDYAFFYHSNLTMFAKLSTTLLALAFVSGVIAGGHPSEVEYEQCNGGTVQCCNSVQDSKNMDQSVEKVITGLGINVNQLTGMVGVSCTGVNVLAVGGGSSWFVDFR